MTRMTLNDIPRHDCIGITTHAALRAFQRFIGAVDEAEVRQRSFQDFPDEHADPHDYDAGFEFIRKLLDPYSVLPDAPRVVWDLPYERGDRSNSYGHCVHPQFGPIELRAVGFGRDFTILTIMRDNRVIRVYADRGAHTAFAVKVPHDSRERDFGGPHDTVVREFGICEQTEADALVAELTACDAAARGVYCYTHNPVRT